MQNKKLMTIPILLTFILLITGFAYACWSETLYINGTVETGTLCAEILDASNVKDKGIDWTCDIIDGTFQNVRETCPPKDIGSTTVTKIDDHTVEVEMDNIYSGYYEEITIHVHNCGTIPWKILRVNFTSAAGTEVILCKGDPSFFTWDVDNDGTDDFAVNWGNHIGAQVDPCSSPEISFQIYVLQSATEGASMDFTVKMDIVNWNCDEPCR